MKYTNLFGGVNIVDMTEHITKQQEKDRVLEYELCLIKLYGVIVRGKDLRHVLGYKTGDAFRQAVRRKQLPIPTFVPEGRRMRVARTHDIAKWLVSLDAVVDEYMPAKDNVK